MEQVVLDVPEVVGKFRFRALPAEEMTAEAQERWSRRAETLAAWLLSEWRREQREEAA